MRVIRSLGTEIKRAIFTPQFPMVILAMIGCSYFHTHTGFPMFTASDYYKGYTASSPSNDTGTVAPTASLADFPYLSEHSEDAMEYFYYVLGDRLWGEYGFKDSFALKEQWFASSYIAIDQGPIVIMMENYRTGLLWNYFMRNEDVRRGLDKLGFTY